MAIEELMDYILLLLPLIIINLGLVIFSLVKIIKDGVGNLSKGIWIVIVLFFNMVGPILFLIIGRKKDDYDKD